MDHLTDAPVANILILAGIIFLAVGLFGRIGGFIGSIFGNIEAGKNSRVLAGVLGSALILGGAWLHEGGHKPAASTPSPMTPAQVASPASSTPPAGTAAPSATTPAAPEVAHEVPGTKARAAQSAPAKTIKPVTPETSTPAAAHDKSRASTPLPPSGDDRLIGTWTNLIPHADSIKRIEIVRVGQDLNAHLWYSCTSGECDKGTHRLDVSGAAPSYELDDSNRHRTGFLTLQTPAVLHLMVDVSDTSPRRRWQQHWVLTKSTMSETTLRAFARYLDASSPKAFAMAPGVYSYQTGARSDDAAKEKALQGCEKRGKPGCRIILVNNDATE
ncbi:MAG TPA: hypothetical protein VN310_08030 [Candidatus Dormibacteraeota bacterium]|jgi:hypothetical protein|nr:hypothetical protein [Candidatus Dormibacteraeota bacterium]